MKTSIPLLYPRHQRRQRLLDMLDAGGPEQVTIVSAPAGFGKTQLLAEWAAGLAGPVAWVSFDAADDDRRFWAALLTAIGSCVEPGSAVHRLAIPGAPSGDPEFLAAVAGIVDALPTPIRLILDDVHELTAAEPLHGLAALTRDRSSRMRLVLSGRTDPPLSVARLRLNGELCEIRAEQLRFRLPEVEAKLAAEGLELRPAQVRLLVEQTGGWAAGLRLAEISLRETDDPDRFLADLAGNGRAVSDYLVGEVLSRLDPDTLDVLRAVSICDEVPAELAAALALRPDAGEVLDAMEHRTALVASHGIGRTTYRIQALLRAHLRADLQRRRPDLAVALHVRAAAWYADRGPSVDALTHARLGGDTGQVAALLRRHGIRLVAEGRHSTVRTTVAWLADRHAAADPWFPLVDALAAMEVGDTRAVDSHLTAAGGPADTDTDELRLLVRSRRAGLAVDAQEMERVPAVAPGPPTEGERWEIDAMARLDQAFMKAASGHPADAIGPARDVLDGSRRRRHGYLAARALAVLSAAAAAAGDYRRMSALAEEADAVMPGSEWPATAAAALTSTLRAYGALLRAEPARCLEHLDAVPRPEIGDPVAGGLPYIRSALRGSALVDLGRVGEGLAELATGRTAAAVLHNPPQVTAIVATLEHGAAVASGRTDQARAALAWAEDELGTSVLDVAFLHGRRHVDLGRWEAAGDALRTVLDGPASVLAPWTRVEARVLRCLLALRAGRRHHARQELGRALAAAGSTGVLRPLAFGPPDVVELLTRHLGGFGDLEPVAGRVLELRHALGPADAPIRLTARERDVLGLLPTQRSLEEIAGELTVSHSTVKTHVKAIYAKLDARSRREAVTAARRHGLIGATTP
ncbi:LuxR C-terminal-related transcriptional regulator [Pseudonocardia sp.]|uniref:LuxR C-terminal-related transcriptional regulator n=1 Tax=Pseudonocardia sp. TaxID=60912 RepID=UPI0026222455|nr:LuxR C-terminal-related transcriptional regulator [Pseudonocardia sp.]